MKSIRSKILASQIVVILLLSFILGISSYLLILTYLKSIQKEELVLSSKYEANSIQNTIQDIKSIIVRVSESKMIKNYNRFYQEHTLVESFVKFQKKIPLLTYVDENGFEDVKVIRNNLSVNLRDLNRTALYQKAMQNRNTVVISFSVEDPDLGVPTLNFAIAKYDYFDEFGGIIVGTVPLYDITRGVDEFQIGKNGFACLIHEDGTILSYPSERVSSRKHSKKIKKVTDFTSRADVGQSGFIRANILDTDSFISHTPISIMKWSLLVVLPYHEFMEAPNLIKKIVIASFCIVLAIGIIISLSVSGNITKPLKKLVTSTDAIARGDLSKKVDIKSQDEIGILARYFNTMVKELKKSHDDLEKQVRNRTARLSKTNEELEIKINDYKMAKDELNKAYEELKATQSQLVQSGKLASIGELASGVAHELNQPLMVIRGNGQLIKRNLRKNNLRMDELMEQLEPIERSTKRMMNIINHLRTFSRQSKSEFQPVDVNKIIEDSLLMISEQLRLRDIEIKKDLSANLPKIKGDDNQLEQIILNLITNARDAVETRDKGGGAKGDSIQSQDEYKGKIEIITRLEELPNKQSKNFVEILVRDNGGGIPVDSIEKIFDPFFTTKEVGKGTGLGLSISYGIIKDHKGEIKVAETGPERTTFKVKLPELNIEY